MKKVIIWTSSYPPLLGGLQTVSQQLAQGLAEIGYQVLVLTNHYSRHHPKKENHGNLSVVRIRHWQPYHDVGGLKGWILACLGKIIYPIQREKIKNCIQTFSPNTINVHFPTNQLVYWAAIKNKFPNVRLVVSLHGHDLTQWFETDDAQVTQQKRIRLTNSAAKRLDWLTLLFSQAQAITACSNWLLEQSTLLNFQQRNKTFKSIYNAISLTRYEKKYCSPEIQNYIFGFGRLEYHKGFDLLIRAFADISHKYQEHILVVGGAGNERNNLESLAQSLSIQNRVYFPGRLSPEQVVQYNQHASIIVIPSRREPFGITVLEALASGNPVIASKIGGIPEAGGHQVHLIELNTKSLVEKISDIIDGNIPGKYKYQEHLDMFSLTNFIENYKTVLFEDK